MTSIATDARPVPTDEPSLNDEQTDEFLQPLAGFFGSPLRSPVVHRPEEFGLEYESVTFPSLDGVPLEAWFIPAEGSDRIIIANHPLGFSRSGMPTDREPWRSIWATYGNDFDVNLVADYKILHDNGYNVLTYDVRNFGLSGAANGGVFTAGPLEARDVLGSLRYVRSREDTQNMTIGLFSRCMGCNATMFAMTEHPEAFEGVRCMVSPQPLTPRVTMEHILALAGVPLDRMDDLDERILLQSSFRLDDMSPVPEAKSVRIPTFLYQVHDDVLTRPSDVQAMYDNIPIDEKQLMWIEGTTRRWDGYAQFAKDPEPMLAWFKRYMGS